jgi:uncharacterized membrane protein
MYDFIYICLFNMVPRKAVLGRSNSATTLYTICLSLIYLILLIVIIAYGPKFQAIHTNLLAIVILIFAGNFAFNRIHFLKFSKQRSLLQKYQHWKKWKLKALGILFLTLSFALFIALSIVVSLR